MCNSVQYCGAAEKIAVELTGAMIGVVVALGGAVQLAGNFVNLQLSSISALGWVAPVAMLLVGAVVFKLKIKAAACHFSDNRAALLGHEERIVPGRLITE